MLSLGITEHGSKRLVSGNKILSSQMHLVRFSVPTAQGILKKKKKA